MLVRRVPGAAWLVRQAAEVLLALTVSGLTAGLGLYLVGAHNAAGTAWTLVGACGAGYALWAMGEAFARRVMEPGSWVMERKMLLTIKQRAERLARTRPTA